MAKKSTRAGDTSAPASPRKSARKSARKTVRKSSRAKPVTGISAVQKKTSAPKKRAQTPRNDNQAFSILGIVLLVLLALFLIVFGVINLLGTDSNDVANDAVIAATVNGVDITTTQLETQYAILPEQYKQLYSKETILQQLINEELLLAYGEEQGLSVTPEDVNEEVQRVLASGQITLTELQENLGRFNLTVEDFEDLIERKLMIELSMAALLSDSEAPSDEDVRAYYEANAGQYVTEDQVTVRHILIASQRDNAAQFSKELLADIEAGADFCELVREETEDKGSVETCGEYTFAQGFMVPEFEKASFALAPGERTIVQTQFGYHIIEKLADVPARIIPFSEAEEEIIAQLQQQAQVTTYQDFLNASQAASTIEVFYVE